MKKLNRPLYSKLYDFPNDLKYEMKQKPKFDSSILNDYSPKVVKSPKSEPETNIADDAASVLSSQTDQILNDDSVVNQIVEDSKKSMSNPATTDMLDELSQTEKIELSDHLRLASHVN